MKYANKLMVVPYVPSIENPNENQIFDLDKEMELILHDKTKTIDEKVKLYNQQLSKYIKTVDQYNLSKAKDQENYVDLFSSKIADKIKTEPEIEQPKVKKVKVEAKAEPKIDIFEPKVQTRAKKVKANLVEPSTPVTSKAVPQIEPLKRKEALRKIEQPIIEQDKVEEEFKPANVLYTYSKEIPELNFKVLENDQQKFLIPLDMKPASIEKLQKTYPDGINVEKFDEYMRTKGAAELEEIMSNEVQKNSAIIKRNNWLIKTAEKFKIDKNIVGKGLKRNWIFKNFFLK